MRSVFPLALVAAAALLALWIDVRFPKLAPQSLPKRVLAAAVAIVLLETMPLSDTSTAALRTSLALLLVAVTLVFLTSVWLVRSVREARL